MMGMINWLRDQMMFPILNFFHSITGSYGWAIILLTITIKLALMPLTIQQFRNMQGMAKLQPKIKELQEKYKDKPEELNKKVMEFYREHKFNPFGGCLPMLIQMPFLIALYVTLISEAFTKKTHESFYFIQDLARLGMKGPDGLHFDNIGMLVLYGITTYWSQKMVTTNPNDPMQKQMMVMMPIIITLTFVSFPVPSGIFLYLVVSNLITIGQYLIMGWHGMLPTQPAATAITVPGRQQAEQSPAAPELAGGQEKQADRLAAEGERRKAGRVKDGGSETSLETVPPDTIRDHRINSKERRLPKKPKKKRR